MMVFDISGERILGRRLVQLSYNVILWGLVLDPEKENFCSLTAILSHFVSLFHRGEFADLVGEV